MLVKFGDFLGTPAGFWCTMLATALTGVWALFDPDTATYILSVIAIIIPALILRHDAARNILATERDKVMHAKLDTLLRNTDEDTAELEGAEPDEAEDR